MGRLKEFVVDLVYQRLWIAIICQHVQRPTTSRIQSIVTSFVNLHVSVRFTFFLLALYFKDAGWIKLDRLAQLAFVFNSSNFMFMFSAFFARTFLTIVIYLYFASDLVRDMFVIVHDLINVNVRDIYNSNILEWQKIRARYSWTNWLWRPVHSVHSVCTFVTQAYRNGTFEGKPIRFSQSLEHFPIVYRSVRIKCVIYWIVYETIVMTVFSILNFLAIMITIKSFDALAKESMFIFVQLVVNLFFSLFAIKCVVMFFLNHVFIYMTLWLTFNRMNRIMDRLCCTKVMIALSFLFLT